MTYEYKQIVPPDDFPGKVYSHGAALEHHVVWWENTGEVPGGGEVIHHINGDPTDNRFENLELMDKHEHMKLHAEDRSRDPVEGHFVE